ncbi:MAG: aspartyl/glutamyl-tRNA amidotransferase subunit A [Candidatus Tectomicrobia bacterium]|nr:aspartyl/glutamyl-tRNA amidotransferase subunit A [Candidatus Tectomicrobia bacterium]
MSRVHEEVCFLTISDLASKIKTKELSPVEVIQAFLDRIERINGQLNAFLTVTGEFAIDAARAAEREIMGGKYRGPLHGIPFSLKDNYYTKGIRTTGGSLILAEFVPEEDSTVATRLQEAGAILVGKAHCNEFATGEQHPHYGPTRNPWNLEHTTGGSSGGSGSAVAASLCLLSMGSDTGGSIRGPASYCGIAGIRPTSGRVSCHGVIPLSWSLDTAGPLTKSVEDNALVLKAVAGWDPLDPFSADIPVPDYTATLNEGMKGLRVGIPRHHFYEGLDSEVEDAVNKALTVFKELGASLEEVTIPQVEYASFVYDNIVPPEAASYHEPYLATQAEKYAPTVRTRFEVGQFMLATQYIKALRVRNVLRANFLNAMEKVDLLVTPTTATPAPKIGETPARRTPSGLTSAFSVAGVPALSIPCGFSSSGLPIGLQMAGKPFAEAILYRAAQAYEKVTAWESRRPPLSDALENLRL